MIQYCFPEGKCKALTFSYDDAQIYDRRLVSIFNQYGIKATFHLNSGKLDKDGFIRKDEVRELYTGHEVACHGVTHPFFNQLSQAQMVQEIYGDRMALEACSGALVRGMSYPFGEFNDDVIRIAKDLGIVYNRTVEDRMNFFLPSDFMLWHPTCHHNKVTDAQIEDFLAPPGYRTMSLFYIWGHSFEFEREGNWDKIREICGKLQNKEDVWYATNIEIYEYVTAMRSLVTSADGNIIYNPTATTLWMVLEGRKFALPPGMRLNLHTYSETR